MNFRAQAIGATGERSDDGKKKRRPPVPNGRIAVPQQIAPAAIAQCAQLRTEGTDLGGEVAGTQGYPLALLVWHVRMSLRRLRYADSNTLAP